MRLGFVVRNDVVRGRAVRHDPPALWAPHAVGEAPSNFCMVHYSRLALRADVGANFSLDSPHRLPFFRPPPKRFGMPRRWLAGRAGGRTGPGEPHCVADTRIGEMGLIPPCRLSSSITPPTATLQLHANHVGQEHKSFRNLHQKIIPLPAIPRTLIVGPLALQAVKYLERPIENRDRKVRRETQRHPGI